MDQLEDQGARGRVQGRGGKGSSHGAVMDLVLPELEDAQEGVELFGRRGMPLMDSVLEQETREGLKENSCSDGGRTRARSGSGGCSGALRRGALSRGTLSVLHLCSGADSSLGALRALRQAGLVDENDLTREKDGFDGMALEVAAQCGAIGKGHGIKPRRWNCPA